MYLALTSEQKEHQAKAALFASRWIEPAVPEMEATDRPPTGLIREMGRLGFMRVRIPSLNQDGQSHLERVIFLEAISRYSAAVGLLMVGQLLGIAAIMQFGGPALKRTYLPPLLAGEMLVAWAITESVGGSDPTATATRAIRQGDQYVLNGRKVFITNSHLAGLALVAARTSSDPRRGLSMIAVDTKSSGFRPGHAERKIGLKGCVTGELIMEDVRVPAENVLGREGEGLTVALKGISEYGRNGTAAVALGLMQAMYEETRAIAAEARPTADPEVTDNLSAIYADMTASRLLTYHASWLLDRGERADAEIATSKFFSTEASLRCAQRAQAIAGRHALVFGHPLERYFRDCVPLVSADGTGNIQRIVTARSLIGKS